MFANELVEWESQQPEAATRLDLGSSTYVHRPKTRVAGAATGWTRFAPTCERGTYSACGLVVAGLFRGQ